MAETYTDASFQKPFLNFELDTLLELRLPLLQQPLGLSSAEDGTAQALQGKQEIRPVDTAEQSVLFRSIDFSLGSGAPASLLANVKSASKRRGGSAAGVIDETEQLNESSHGLGWGLNMSTALKLNANSEPDSIFGHAPELQLAELDLPPLHTTLQSSDSTTISETERSVSSVLQQDSQPETQEAVEISALGPEDVWRETLKLPPLHSEIKYLSWEAFYDSSHHDQVPAFVSEAGPVMYDAMLQLRAERNGRQAARLIKTAPFLRALWLMSIGHKSLLFEYDTSRNTFVEKVPDARMSGFSLETVQSFVEEVKSVGNLVMKLKRATTGIFGSIQQATRTTSKSAVSIALDSAISTILECLEEFSVLKVESLSSPLQLLDLIRRIRTVLAPVNHLLETLGDNDLEATKARKRKGAKSSDAEKLARVFNYVQRLEENNDPAYYIIRQVFVQMAQPWIETFMVRTGLAAGNTSEDDREEDESALSSLMWSALAANEKKDHLAKVRQAMQMPAFVSDTDIETVLETRQCLRYMKAHHPEHALVSTYQRVRQTPVKIDWCFSWEDVERVSQKAARYEEELKAVIALHHDADNASSRLFASLSSQPSSTPPSTAWPGISDVAQLEASIQQLDSIPQTNPANTSSSDSSTSRKLYSLTSAHLAIMIPPEMPSPLEPPLAITPHLTISPLIRVQHSLLTSATIDSILHQQHLRAHLRVLYSYYLCGSGLFTSRLSAILFSPESAAAARQTGVLRTAAQPLGLRLGAQDGIQKWPPTSAELRLALMNVLSDTWASFDLATTSSRSSNFDSRNLGVTDPDPDKYPRPGSRTSTVPVPAPVPVPGDLSFTLRTSLPADELERISDRDSIYALDFLALSYSPPAPLACILSESELSSYDKIFRQMLRMLRVDFVVKQLFHLTGSAHSRGLSDNSNNSSRTAAVLVSRFRYSATTLFSRLAAHFVQTGIQTPFRAFERFLDTLEQGHSYSRHSGQSKSSRIRSGELDRPDRPAADERSARPGAEPGPGPGTSRGGSSASLAEVVQAHSRMLRQIESALLLRSEQRVAKQALDTLCGDVLGFAKLLALADTDAAPDPLSQTDGGGGGGGARLRARLVKGYADFKEHVGAFKAALETSSGTTRSMGGPGAGLGLHSQPDMEMEGAQTALLQHILVDFNM